MGRGRGEERLWSELRSLKDERQGRGGEGEGKGRGIRLGGRRGECGGGRGRGTDGSEGVRFSVNGVIVCMVNEEVFFANSLLHKTLDK